MPENHFAPMASMPMRTIKTARNLELVSGDEIRRASDQDAVRWSIHNLVIELSERGLIDDWAIGQSKIHLHRAVKELIGNA